MAYEGRDADSAAGVVYGRNAVSELLKSGRDIDKILVRAVSDKTNKNIPEPSRDGRITAIVSKAKSLGIPVAMVDKRKLDSYSPDHQGVVALVPERDYATPEELIMAAESKGEAPLLVVLDHIYDPRNLGAVIRCAECAGAHGVIIPKRNSATLSAAASKAAAGADSHIGVAKVGNIAVAIETLKSRGIWVYSAEPSGSSVYDTDLNRPAAFVFGSEGEGVSRLVREKSDFVISIPMYGRLNSLNVSSAASVILFEAARQRRLL
ncbi:MAG: 23S rRNA (guanosine(2251)-2'-O)-methyltransferase RlmB [Eubacteriales bacterium]|jgi:23S rRNA (guanosine2251-2'-O)-methyltransferase